MFFVRFNAGVRAVDIRDSCNPQEIGYFIHMPAATGDTDMRCSYSTGAARSRRSSRTVAVGRWHENSRIEFRPRVLRVRYAL